MPNEVADQGAEAPEGPGWWRASDGLWYPPPAPEADRWIARPANAGCLIGIVAFVALVAVAFIAAGAFVGSVNGTSSGSAGPAAGVILVAAAMLTVFIAVASSRARERPQGHEISGTSPDAAPLKTTVISDQTRHIEPLSITGPDGSPQGEAAPRRSPPPRRNELQKIGVFLGGLVVVIGTVQTWMSIYHPASDS